MQPPIPGTTRRLFLVVAAIGVVALLGFSVDPAAAAGRHFWRGRPRNGTLGRPSTTPRMCGRTPAAVVGDGSAGGGLCAPLPADEWHTQLLDHFAPTDARTWQQRFFTNAEFYGGPGSPVFLMIGGEGEATADWMVQGAWWHYAREHKALMLQLEHRYYGKSRPTE